LNEEYGYQSKITTFILPRLGVFLTSTGGGCDFAEYIKILLHLDKIDALCPSVWLMIPRTLTKIVERTVAVAVEVAAASPAEEGEGDYSSCCPFC
jgi:hypothetical protein